MEPTAALATEKGKPVNKRILLIDILRGFALFGIIINHISINYLAGPPPPGNAQFNIFSSLDHGVFFSGQVLTFGKFFTIFSFLFGLSFALQIDGAANKGTAFNLRFLWRLLILFAIGYVHNLFYSGDILVIYAVLGLFLLPFRYVDNKVLVPLALLLIINIPGLVQDIVNVAAPPSSAEQAANGDLGKAFAAVAAEQFRIKSAGTIGEVVRMNAVDGFFMKLTFQVITGRLWITFGLFLLGMYAGRKKIFDLNPEHHQFFKKLLLWSGITAVVATAAALYFGIGIGRASSVQQLIGNFAWNVHQAALAAFYVAGLTLLYKKAQGASKLNLLAPVGQIGLSTYLIQSMFALPVYFGFGLGMMDKLGVTTSVGLGVAFFIAQVVFSNWWVKHYQFGLVEWLWRSLTFMKVQPLRKRAEPLHAVERAATPSVIMVDSKENQSV